jgi:hypothetical protein
MVMTSFISALVLMLGLFAFACFAVFYQQRSKLSLSYEYFAAELWHTNKLQNEITDAKTFVVWHTHVFENQFTLH